MDAELLPDDLHSRFMKLLLAYAGILLLAGIVIIFISATSSDSSMPPNTRRLVLATSIFCVGIGLFAGLLYILELNNNEQNVVLSSIRLKSLILMLRTAPFVIFIGGAAIYLVGVNAFGTGSLPTVVTVVAGLLIVLNLLGALSDLRTYFNPRSDSSYKGLASYGDLQQLIEQIDTEMRTSPTSIGKTHVTKNWIVYIARTEFMLIRLTDVVWLYGKHFSLRINSSTTQTDSVIIYNRSKKKLELEQSESSIADLVKAIAARAPWAIAGYDAQFLAQWNSNPDAIIATVNKRQGM